MKSIYPHSDPDELRILGRISDDVYYMMKMRDAAARYDVYEQKRLMRLKYLEKRQKEKKAAEEAQKKQAEERKKKQAEEKAQKEAEKKLQDAIEKELPKQIEKEIGKQIEKIFS
jgi:dGTP triphosphohydrolase